MNFLVATVPHTGTNKIANMLHRAGYELKPRSHAGRYNNITITTHIDSEKALQGALRHIQNGYIPITPIRHPYCVYESWKRRGGDIKKLIETYKRLPRLGAFYIPIDGERDKYIKQINHMLGINLEPEWGEVVNGLHNTHSLTYKDIDPPEEIKALEADMFDFLRTYYEGIMPKKPKEEKKEQPKQETEEYIQVITVRKIGLEAYKDQEERTSDRGELVWISKKNARILQKAGAIEILI